MAETLPQMTEMIVNAATEVQTHGKQYKGDIV